MFRFLVIFWLQLAGYSGLQWAERFQDNSGPMEVCSGQNIQLFWNFTLAQDEHVKDMVWTCQPEGNATELLASYVDDTFMPMSEFSGRLSHLQDGGIELSCATILESGNYSVTVNTVDNNGDETLYRQTAWVKVVDTPKTQNGRIKVRQEREAVRDDTSDRQWHVHLSCGHFSDLGHPPVEAEWKTPNGETLSSSYFHKGNFHLLLSNPVKGGNYTCSLPSLSPATRCLPPGSVLRDDVTVYVDEVAARFSIMEAHQVAMETRLDEERAAFAVFRDNTSLEKSQMQGEMEDLKNRLDAASTRISFDARLKNSRGNFKGRLQPFNIITNEGDALNGTTGIFTTPRNGTTGIFTTPRNGTTGIFTTPRNGTTGIFTTPRNGTTGIFTTPRDGTTGIFTTPRNGTTGIFTTPRNGTTGIFTTPRDGTTGIFTTPRNGTTGIFTTPRNGTKGIFTTPRDGTYFFVASSSPHSADKNVYMHLTKEGTRVAFAFAKQYSVYNTAATCHATLHLTVGERVWVESTFSNTFYYYESTSFTGFLLGADDW